MTELQTIFRSNIPVECHIIKGRLETEGIPCFIFDEQMISVHPFKAVAIGGVKLKVPKDKITQSQNILNLVTQDKLIDEHGEYPISAIYLNEIKRQNEILSLKNKIRNDASLLDKETINDFDFIDQIEFEKILQQEKEFLNYSKKKFKFLWKEFFYELFDFNRSVFAYFRIRPVEYYIDKEIVDNYIHQKESEEKRICPNCGSDNVAFGNAIDNKWDIIYLIVSLLLTAPLFPIRKKYHCFDCECDFKR